MIHGAHFLLYSTDPDADRAFLRDVLGWRHVELGGGWLIFRLPPAEMAIHPSDGPFAQAHGGTPLAGTVLYLMCDDLAAEMASLEGRGVACTPVQSADWGSSTTLRLPSGGAIGLYQPTHPTALDMGMMGGTA